MHMGYKGIPLQIVLYKLLVYGEGGHFLKHQDTEKEDGMIATLVVQPPSLHEGGDLVVYRNGEVKHRHDFGKADGTATYLSHYAVHYADAEHSVERVTKGYRLALVYSICLPANMRDFVRTPSMRGELTGAIGNMTPGDDNFALLLAHEYTEKSIGLFGSRALKGVDRERFLALEEANNFVSAEKKLQFHIAKLSHNVNFYCFGGIRSRWGVECHEEQIAWYALDGNSLGIGDDLKFKLNFLNPAMETYSQLWEPYGSSESSGYLGNEGPQKDSVYSRFAIVAWPAVDNVERTMNFASMSTAFVLLRDQGSVDTATLLKYMDVAFMKLAEIDAYLLERSRDTWNGTYEFPPPVSTSTCQVLCLLLLQSGNSIMANMFLSSFFARLKDKCTVALDIAKLVSKFSWVVVGKAFSEAVAAIDGMQPDDYSLKTTVSVVRGLELGKDLQGLLTLAVEQACNLPDNSLLESRALEELWRLILNHGNDRVLYSLSRKFQFTNPRILAPAAKIFLRHLGDTRLPPERKALLVTIIFCRIEWLKRKVRGLEQPFSWEMPVAEFPDCAPIEKFLRGPEATMITTGIVSFEDLWAAQIFVLRYTCGWDRVGQIDASFDMKTGGNKSTAFVTITKTRKWYDTHRESLPQLKKELQELMKAMVGTITEIISKRQGKKRR